MKNSKNHELELDAELKQLYRQEIDNFLQTFKSSKVCMGILWEWKGWGYNEKSKKLDFICSEKGCAGRTAEPIKKSNHKKSSWCIYVCDECRNEVSEISDTIFKGMRKRQWIWFYSYFLMILLRGRKPIMTVVNAYFDNKIDKNTDKYFPDNKKNRHKIRKQVREVMQTLEKTIFFSADKEKTLKEYCKKFSVSYSYQSFEEWFEARDEKKLSWKLAWCGRSAYINKAIIEEWLAIEYKVDEKQAAFARLFTDTGNALEGDWIIAFKKDKKGKIQLRWVYIEKLIRKYEMIELARLVYCLKIVTVDFLYLNEESKAETNLEEINSRKLKRKNKLERKLERVLDRISDHEMKIQVLQIEKYKDQRYPPFKMDNSFEEKFKEQLHDMISRKSNQKKKNTIFEYQKEMVVDTGLLIKGIRKIKN
jgi:hypothetical protein